MQKVDFKGTREIEKIITDRKVDYEGNKINWLTLCAIKLQMTEPFILQMKTTYLQDNFIQVGIKSKQ